MADWFVRPPVISGIDGAGKPIPVGGTYGDQDGTSYEDAWNGLREVVWGTGGVNTGDTLWVCGLHLHDTNSTSQIAAQGEVIVTVDGITIRGDHATDPGAIYGCFIDSRSHLSWSGPDANGVYTISNTGETGFHIYAARFQLVSGAAELLPATGLTTWTSGPGSHYVNGGTPETQFIYIKPHNTDSGWEDTILHTGLGYRFNIGQHSNITFRGLDFVNSLFTADHTEHVNLTENSHHITFVGCSWKWGDPMWMHPGFDDWTFDGCSFYQTSNGIYTLLDALTEGAHRLIVRNSTFTEMAPATFPHNDGHGVAVQGGEGHKIEHNLFDSTHGTSIEFWTFDQPMRNHTIRWNTILTPSVNVTAGNGIAVSGDNTESVEGLRTGFRIYGNLIVGAGVNGTETHQGYGIGSNNKDSMDIFNNVVYGCRGGIRLGVSTSGTAKARLWNNMVIAPSALNYIFISLPDTGGGLDIDNNLYDPATDTTTGFTGSIDYGSNNVFGDPLFAVDPPEDMADVHLGGSSPALAAGQPLPYVVRDYRSFSFHGTTPEIGAVSAADANPLYPSIDEMTASDAEYIQSEEAPRVSRVEFLLSTVDDPLVATNHHLRYRYKRSDASAVLDLTVTLKQGATTIASWQHNGVSTSWTDAEQTLSEAQANAITDYSDLRVEFIADTP